MRELIASSRVLLLLSVLTGLFFVGSVTLKNMDVLTIEPAAAQTPTAANANPLLSDWTGPYGGVPPFDKVQIALFKPAIEAGMTENLAEIDKIAKNSAAPTFENTIAEL